jgi:DNA polymerase bacteriophage-type
VSTLRIDIETYSSVDLKACGVHRYVEAPDFEITMFQYAFGDSEVNVISLLEGEQIPQHVLRSITDPTVTKTAFNAAFEITGLSKHLGEDLDPAQWRCTSVHALYLGLPNSLGEVGKVLGLAEDKQKLGGWGLIRYFCMPCKPTKANGQRTRNLPHHDPAKWSLFKDYGKRDVETEREAARKIEHFPLPQKEQRLWVLDQRMNRTGIQVNTTLVANAIRFDAAIKERLTAEAMELTGLDNPGSREQLLAWLQEEMPEGDEPADITKKTVKKLLTGVNDSTITRVLELRQELAKSSTSKFIAMARAVCNDGRVRGLTQFYGANRTGRWAGRLVQFQNLPQNKLRDIDLARKLLIEGDLDTFEMLFGNVPDTLSQLIRTAFEAKTGHKFVDVDFSAIEARMLAWLSWCQWRLDVFATHGKIYEASAEQMFKLPAGSVTKKSPYRQRGKVAELALGYQGGANALVTMGALEMGLTMEELDPIKVAWREANPEVVKFWYACEGAAKQAVANKTSVTLPIAGGRSKLVFAYESGFLTILLPVGRKLFYVKPRIEQEDLVRELASGAKYVVARAGSLTYEGSDQKTKKWTRLSSYGGKLVENLCQAISRDCLAESMLELDAKGFTQLVTVHDQDICEEPIDGHRDVRLAEELMGMPIAWAPGLLLRADGFETTYHMKEIE